VLVIGKRLDAVAELPDVPVVGTGLLALLEAAVPGLLGTCGAVASFVVS